MASPDETLREELVRFLTRIPPSRLPQRADGGHYAVALAPCCTPALKRQCEAADAALARLRAAAREDGRPGAAAAHAGARLDHAAGPASAIDLFPHLFGKKSSPKSSISDKKSSRISPPLFESFFFYLEIKHLI